MRSRDSDIKSRQSDINSQLTIPPTSWYRSLTAAGLRNPAVHGRARYWLQVEGSFTRALQKQCIRSFHVEVRREGFGSPSLEESRRLAIPPRQHAWIREVRLCGDGEPWVLARTVIPLNCLEGEGRRLLHLKLIKFTWTSICSSVLISKTWSYLKIFIKSRNHNKLFKLLRRLR